MKRRIMAALLAAVIILSSFAFLAIGVSAESLYIKKIVYVVYDDSGSMGSGKDNYSFAYANYALQTLCGMLNSEDQLYIRYLSDYACEAYTGNPIGWSSGREAPLRMSLESDDIQSSVDSIRTYIKSDWTPLEPVTEGFDRLAAVEDDDPNTQYWMVVIADGVFNDYERENLFDSEEDEKKLCKNGLNKEFGDFVKREMPNGTYPQVTFLSIGSNSVAPDEDENAGIFVEEADTSDGIISAMNRLADRISGRTRLEGKAIKKSGKKSIQVESSIPLLNMVVLSQSSDAKIESVKIEGKERAPLEVVRSASIGFNGDDVKSADAACSWSHDGAAVNLSANSFLAASSDGGVISKGTYTITFDKEIEKEDIVVLFEPALEVRMFVTLNGNEIKDFSELDEAREGDVIGVSCKVFEMETDNEVSPDVLPKDSSFELTVLEDDGSGEMQVKKSSDGKTMTLDEYTLRNISTEIRAKVSIKGFEPIVKSVQFKPLEHIVKYDIKAEFASAVQSLKYDKFADNKDLAIVFTVFADGEAITDPAAVNALNFKISELPGGNHGVTKVDEKGRIIFTPDKATDTGSSDDYYSVPVTCSFLDTEGEEKSATLEYTVLLADYAVLSKDAEDAVRKNEFFKNKIGASFTIERDGKQLKKSDIDTLPTVTLNEEHSELKVDVKVEDDGTVVCTPYSENERKLNFGRWLFNWAYYFGLEGEDVTVTFSHPLGNGEAVVPVRAATLSYQIWCVYAPLITLIIVISLIVAYVVRFITKPRFAVNGAVYIGSLTKSFSKSNVHLCDLSENPLKEFNKLSNKTIWNPFKEVEANICGIRFIAGKGNKLICMADFPWYTDSPKSKNRSIVINGPGDIVNYCMDGRELEIAEIKPIRVMDSQDRLISQDDSVYYVVGAEVGYAKTGNGGRMEVIENATIFCYSTIRND